MSLKDYSTTAGSNTSAAPNGAPEGWALSDINNTVRQIMADIRTLAASDTIASAATCDLGTKDSTFLTVSGTTTITALGTVSAGIYKFVTFSGALTLTHHATSLILLGGANRTTVAGDVGMYLSLGSGNWKECFFSPISTSSSQPLDAQLTTLAGVTAQQATDLAAVSTFMGTVLNAADAATARSTLGCGIQASATNQYIAGGTMPTSDIGKAVIYNSVSPGTLTLPAIPAQGLIVSISNLNSGTCTVARAGSATLYAKGLSAQTSIAFLTGESIQLVSDGSNWVQVSFSKP
jgi:hypothetical protein